MSVLRTLISEAAYALDPGGLGRGLRMLTYHRVTDAHPESRLCVPVARFEAQMRWLAGHGYRSARFADAVAWVTNGVAPNWPATPVVITFDDGFEDNYLHAAPAMERHKLHGIFFVPSQFIQDSEQGGHAPADRPMGWEQLGDLIARGHEIGAHSVTHRKLAGLPPDDVTWEAKASKEALEGKLRRRVDFFCYPAGDYTRAVRDIVERAGYHGACTVEPGATLRGADPFLLTRTEVSAFDSLRDFEKKLAGAYDGLHRWVQRHDRKRWHA